MNERRTLFNLSSYANVNGRVSEWKRERRGVLDVLALRRFCRVTLDRQGAQVFTRFYWGIMASQENMFRRPRQKRVLGNMIRKVLVPYIYQRRVWRLDETLWPISLAEFQALNEQLAIKFPEIHASHQWQAIAHYYNEIVQELETRNE